MSVKIGHASIDENGKASGGTAGDQTGKELCTRNWYNSGWNVLLRPVSSELAEKSAKACEAACANPKIGYDQQGRNTLFRKADAVGFDLSMIYEPCECDCSSLMHVCAIAGGAHLSYGSNGCTTRTMVRSFSDSGDYLILTDSKWLTSDQYLQRGDILVKEGSHTVMVLSNGDLYAPATVTPSVKKEDDATVYYSVRLPLLKNGYEGESVKALQLLLIAYGHSCGTYGADGEFGKDTLSAVEAFQREKGLDVDGKVGPKTWAKLLGVMK